MVKLSQTVNYGQNWSKMVEKNIKKPLKSLKNVQKRPKTFLKNGPIGQKGQKWPIRSKTVITVQNGKYSEISPKRSKTVKTVTNIKKSVTNGQNGQKRSKPSKTVKNCQDSHKL